MAYDLKAGVGNCLYVKEGCEHIDVSAEIIINFADKQFAYTGVYLSLPINRKEILQLKDYLDYVIKTLDYETKKMRRSVK